MNFCPMCHKHYNYDFHRNKGHCNDYKCNGGCNHTGFCLVKNLICHVDIMFAGDVVLIRKYVIQLLFGKDVFPAMLVSKMME